MLSAAGAILARTLPFPDHHAYTERELRRLIEDAARLEAVPVTTPKDAARLPAAFRDRFCVVRVALAWDDPAALDGLLAQLMV